MDYSKVPIPDVYTQAIEKAMEDNGVSPSTVRLKHVLAALPDDSQDKPAAIYFIKAYKAQHKRVSPVAALVAAVNRAIENMPADCADREYLLTAVQPFTSTTAQGE